MIDKKIIFKSLIIILLLIIIIFTFIQIRNTLAKYETATTTERNVDVAFWLVNSDFAQDGTTFESKRIIIEDIYPRDEAFSYTFTVSNFDKNDKIAEVDFDYNLVLTATTNLPLKYEIKRNGTTCATFDPTDTTNLSNIIQKITDSDGTYYIKMKAGTESSPFIIDTIDGTTNQKRKVTDTFEINVIFPKGNNVDAEYADLMEDIKLELFARQVIGE